MASFFAHTEARYFSLSSWWGWWLGSGPLVWMGLRVVGRATLRWPDRVVALGRLLPSQSGGVRWASLRRLHQLTSVAYGATAGPQMEGVLLCSRDANVGPARGSSAGHLAFPRKEADQWRRSRCSTLCPRFNERSDVEATTRLASEAMPTHNPYAPSIRAARCQPPIANSSTNRNLLMQLDHL